MKSNQVPFIPKGYQSVTPYLIINGAERAITFYKKAFGAKEVMRVSGPHGTLGHAEIEINGHRLMLADEYPDMNCRVHTHSVAHRFIHVYVKNSDATVNKAVAAGAKLHRPVQDQFYGDRSGSIEDPFGHTWHIATHTRGVPLKEMKKQAADKAANIEQS
ncbi:MAG: VOC family protein [Nitrospira sp.]|nr:VOC family protein [Nitrospira sp.]